MHPRHGGRRDGPVFGAGGRREGHVLGGVFRPRFSGRIWRFLHARLGVVLVGRIARYIDGVPIVQLWDWLTPRRHDVVPGGRIDDSDSRDDSDDSDDRDDSDDSDDRSDDSAIARICYDEAIPAGGPARIPYFENLPNWTASYFSDHWGGVRAGCDSSETAHSSDSEDYGMPRPARPRGSRAARRRRVALRALQEMLRALRALRGFREVLRAFRALRAVGARPSAG